MSEPQDQPESNPYESPKSAERSRSRPWTIVGIVLLSIAILPATLIAFFFSCVGTLSLTDEYSTGGSASMVVGAFVGIIVFGLMLWGIIHLARGWRKKG